MKYATILTLLLCTGQSWGGPLVGIWVYDTERTMSELRSNPNTPTKVLKCFELGVCGSIASYEYTPTHWRQYLTFDGGESHVSEFSEYRVLEETPEYIVIAIMHEGEEVESRMSIQDKNNLSYTVSHKGFKWVEYLRRAH